MMEPRTLDRMIERSTLERTKAAIGGTLGRQLLGVTVIGHPGKLDINDVVAKAVVKAPGVAVGWTRQRADRDVAGGYRAVVDWAAYVVVEDLADLAAKRRVARETVGYAIGSTILEILDDPDLAAWGLAGLGYPLAEPAPAFTPVLTMKSAENGADFYAVTWTQAAWGEGTPWLGEGSVAIREVERLPEARFAQDPDDPDGDRIPTEILAMMRSAS